MRINDGVSLGLYTAYNLWHNEEKRRNWESGWDYRNEFELSTIEVVPILRFYPIKNSRSINFFFQLGISYVGTEVDIYISPVYPVGTLRANGAEDDLVILVGFGFQVGKIDKIAFEISPLYHHYEAKGDVINGEGSFISLDLGLTFSLFY